LALALIGGLAAPALVGGAAPAAAAPGVRCPATAVGLIAQKWRALGRETGPLGCPTAPERDLVGRRGRVSTFEHGQVVWSPDQGPSLVIAAYQQDRSVVVDWGSTTPHRYDFFLVRWDIDGRNAGQREIRGGARDRGRVVLPAGRSGGYAVSVEGCTSRTLRPARCSQKWTAAASVAVRLTGPRARPVLTGSQDGDRMVFRWTGWHRAGSSSSSASRATAARTRSGRPRAG
jgi:hypothetical protein